MSSKSVIFVLTRCDNQAPLNLIYAARDLVANGHVGEVSIYLANQSADVQKAMGSLGKEGILANGAVPFAGERELASALQQLRRRGEHIDCVYFNEFSDLFFYSYLSLNKDIPHIVHDIHMLHGFDAFARQAKLGRQQVNRLFERQQPPLTIHYLFPGFKYLYLNCGIPECCLQLSLYGIYFPIHTLSKATGNCIFSGGGHRRDFHLLGESVEKLGVSLRVRTHDASQASLLEKAGIATLPPTDYFAFVRELSEAKFVALPLQVEPGISCGLSFLAVAMALGKAIIVTQCESTAGYIEDRVTGLLVPPADASALRGRIKGLDVDSELRMRLGRNALYFAHKNMDLKQQLVQMFAG